LFLIFVSVEFNKEKENNSQNIIDQRDEYGYKIPTSNIIKPNIMMLL